MYRPFRMKAEHRDRNAISAEAENMFRLLDGVVAPRTTPARVQIVCYS